MRKHISGKPVVGWAGSTGHRSGDLKILQKPFQAIKKRVLFHHTGHISSNPLYANEVGLDPSEVTTMEMLTPDEYPHGLAFDIGVIPLSSTPFNEAKSSCKGLEYAAAGVPFIASPSGEYKRLHSGYGLGRLASSKSEWIEHILELMDPDVRSAEAQRQREIVETHFNVKEMARQWDSIVLP
jgi:glycosyltransferase involved in cell wall biosynthesis